MRARFPLNQSLLPDGTPHPLRGETITFVIDRDPETISLEDIKDLQTYAFGKHAKHVKVIVIKETNSIMITCSFSFELNGLLMAEAMKNLKLLKKNGLLKLTIGYCTIWNIRDEEEKEETTESKKVTSESEREMELEQPLHGTDKLNEIISHKDKEVKELQEKANLLTKEFFKTEKEGNDINTVSDELMEEEMNDDITSDNSQQIKNDDVISHDVIPSRNKRKLSQAETESTDDDVKPSKLLKLSNESELVGQTDETIEELQQPLQGKEDQTFPSQTTTTPPSLSDTPSDEEKLMLKQKIRAMSMESDKLKFELMKSKQVSESAESCERNEVVSTSPISSSDTSTTHHHGSAKTVATKVNELQEKVDWLTELLNLFITGNDTSNELMEEINKDITRDNSQQIKNNDVISHDVIPSRNKRKLSQAETESTDDDVKPSKLTKRSIDGELVGQMDEELQQPLQGKEDQTFPSHTTTPPTLSDTPSVSESTESGEKNKVVSTISSSVTSTHHHGSVKELWYPSTKKPNFGARPNVTPQLMNISSKILKEFSDKILDNLSNDQNLCSQLIESLEANLLISTTEKEQALKTSNSIIRSKIIIGVLNTLVQRATNPSKSFGEILSTLDQFESLKSLSEKMKEKAIAEVDLTDQEILHLINKANQAILKYSSKLSTVYKKIKPDHKWSPINTLQPYINLAITKLSADSAHLIHVSVDDVDVMKRLSIEDLCQIPQGSWVLIQGAPGIGKSMLAYEMCKRWMNGTDLQHYSLVLLLQLNDYSIHSKPEGLDDLICHYIDDESWRSDVIKELKSIEGDGILLMLDGYDDLPKDILPHTDKMLNELKSKFHKASIFITTRSSASRFPADTNIQKFEVLGFDELSIAQYSDAFFSKNPAINQRDLFKSYIYKFPILSKCCHIPLHLAIILYIFHKHGQLTMTEFFEKLVCLLIYRCTKSQSANNDVKIPLQIFESLNDLSSYVRDDFNTLCRLAYNGINQDSFMFDSSDDIVTLGLMNKVNKADGIFAYSFLYPAIQEFLGAYHIYKYLPNKVNDYFGNAAQPHVLRFLAGFSKLQEVDIRSHIFDKTVTNLALFHGLLESKNVSGWLEEGKIEVARTWPPNIQPHDMYALGQCISLSHCTWEFGFTFRYLTSEHVKMFVEGINSNSNNVSFIIEYIRFAVNPISNKGVIELFKLPDFVFKSLSQLSLRGVSADNECLKDSFNVLVKVAHSRKLKKFLFHDNNFKEGEQMALIQELVKLPLLRHVSFSQLSSDECSLLLNGSSSIATIELYNISSSAIKSVISCLPNAKSLQHLQIHQSEVTPADIQDLPSLLPSSSIKSLHFKNCAITSDTARSILTAVAASPTVETLSLDDNIIDDECGEYIAMNMESIADKHLHASSTNKLPLKLKELSLDQNPFNEKSIKQLMDKRISIGSQISLKLRLSLKWEEYFDCQNYRFKDKEFFQFGK